MEAAVADDRFEFDAPRFYDFAAPRAAPSPADAWFDTAPEGPGAKPAKRERPLSR